VFQLIGFAALGVLLAAGLYVVMRLYVAIHGGARSGQISRRRAPPRADSHRVAGWMGLARPMRFLLRVILGLLVACSVVVVVMSQRLPAPTIEAGRLAEADYRPAMLVGNLSDPELDEASGLARSHRAHDRMWLINDSGNLPRLYAIGLAGEHHGIVEVRDVENDDWEDIASYVQDGTPYLLIADVGDNRQGKPTRWLHAVEEPELEPGRAPPSAEVVWTLPFRYADGPRDSESVAVDAMRGEILLLSKRDTPAHLYRLPLPRSGDEIPAEPAVARFLTEVRNIPQPTRADAIRRYPRGPMLEMPTSLDVSEDGRLALVLTYHSAYLFERSPDEDWAAAFRGLPARISLPRLNGFESAGFLPGSEAFAVTPERGAQGFFVTSERPRGPLYRFVPQGPVAE
jgi:hypothetical protein